VPGVASLLGDARYTGPYLGGAPGRLSDRTIARDTIRSACQAMNLEDAGEVLRAFVLVMAWGSGPVSSRGIRNTGRALERAETAHAVLARAALGLRTTACGSRILLWMSR